MKLTILTDNNTFIDRYFTAEPGLSIFIEDEGKRILFDCGFSGVFFDNALRMGIDLLHLDALVFSHGPSRSYLGDNASDPRVHPGNN